MKSSLEESGWFLEELPKITCGMVVFCPQETSHITPETATHQNRILGVGGNPRFRDSREYKPQISLPFPWHFVISLPIPGKRNFWPGIKTGNTIIICSLADGWSRHENK